MKRVVKEYGMTVAVVIATVLLFAFWWQMIKEKGTFAQIAETEQVQLELRGRNEEYRRLSEREEPQITYRNQRVYAGERVDGKELFEAILLHQERHHRAELESGQCLTGPHKDDFEASIDDRPVKSFGSQGQTRTASISLKQIGRAHV